MPVVVNTNTISLGAQRHLANNTNALAKTLERLASGYRVNRASDGAADLAVSEDLRTQIRGAKKALENAADGIAILNVADGGLSEIAEHMQRIRELAVQAASDTYDATQRTAMQAEVTNRLAAINQIANGTMYNGLALLNNTLPATFMIQVGPNSGGVNSLNIRTAFNDSTTAAGTGLAIAAVSVTTQANAAAAITTMDTGLTTLGTRRSTVGGFTNQLESVVQNMAINIENISAAESRIRNVDVAEASSDMVRYQILQQASATVLSQANQAPSIALQLISGG